MLLCLHFPNIVVNGIKFHEDNTFLSEIKKQVGLVSVISISNTFAVWSVIKGETSAHSVSSKVPLRSEVWQRISQRIVADIERL